MKLALFTRQLENLPQSYEWEGQRVETNAGIAFCQPFAQERQQAVRRIVIAFKDSQDEDATYSIAWEADIVAVARSAPPMTPGATHRVTTSSTPMRADPMLCRSERVAQGTSAISSKGGLDVAYLEKGLVHHCCSQGTPSWFPSI